MKKLTAVVVGYGGRGAAYAKYAIDHPEELDIVGVAEPNPARRASAAQWHNIPENHQYATWQELASQPKFADFLCQRTTCGFQAIDKGSGRGLPESDHGR